MTDISGYRRIDGYERYDGYPNGALYEYFNVAITATDPDDQALIIPGTLLSRTSTASPSVDIGVVLSTSTLVGDLYYYDVARIGSIDRFTVVEEFLLLSDGEAFLELSDDTGLLKIAGSESGLGDSFIGTTNGTSFAITIASAPVSAKSIVDADTYLTNTRAYSAVLRGSVLDTPNPIAGLYWFNDRCLVAINSTSIPFSVSSGGTQPAAGMLFRWNGVIYRLLYPRLDSAGATNVYTLYLGIVETSTTVDDDLVLVEPDGTVVSTWISDVSEGGATDTLNTDVAQLAFCNNPTVASSRGFTYLTPATDFGFDAGHYSGALTPPITFDNDADPSDAYYVVGDGGATVLKVRLSSVVQTGGSFSGSTATGTAQLVVIEVVAGDRDYVKDDDEIHSVYPTTGSSKTLVVNGTPTLANIAGTGALDGAGTRYVWDTMNFYGQSSTLSAFGATGASRAFWANEFGYGNITAISSATSDTPKYLAFHIGKLALGYRQGSVLLSVIGEPNNFQGEDGALEIATGDSITGLLSLAGDTLAVFGRRTIRKITGYTDADTELGTISGRSTCFDYTACALGQDAVFTGPHGITTLQQSTVYGDFEGENVSDSISTWLRPKLVNRPGFETGGVVCAFPVRSKAQYRLVLVTGDVVVATFTPQGPKMTHSNWGLTGQTRVPYAWSSEVDNQGLERLHVRWADSSLATRLIELDTGWGFDGKTFEHYFELAHLFGDSASVNIGVEKCRLYGQSYGLASLNIKSSGIEDNFLQEYHSTVQDISMPTTYEMLYDAMIPVTAIVDQANWGLGIKLKIQGSNPDNSSTTEPSHICQVLVLQVRTEGAIDG
jgi:hypothetical protein